MLFESNGVLMVLGKEKPLPAEVPQLRQTVPEEPDGETHDQDRVDQQTSPRDQAKGVCDPLHDLRIRPRLSPEPLVELLDRSPDKDLVVHAQGVSRTTVRLPNAARPRERITSVSSATMKHSMSPCLTVSRSFCTNAMRIRRWLTYVCSRLGPMVFLLLPKLVLPSAASWRKRSTSPLLWSLIAGSSRNRARARW